MAGADIRVMANSQERLHCSVSLACSEELYSNHQTLLILPMLPQEKELKVNMKTATSSDLHWPVQVVISLGLLGSECPSLHEACHPRN